MAPSKAVGKVAIIGDDLVGTETALMLGQEGKDVTIVEMRNGIALEDEPLSQIALNTELDAAGVKSLVNAKVKEIIFFELSNLSYTDGERPEIGWC